MLDTISERREETAAAYAEHVKPAAATKPPMGSLAPEPGNAEMQRQAAHDADDLERAADVKTRYPGILPHLDERAGFDLREHTAAQGKTRAQMVAEAEAAIKAAARRGVVHVDAPRYTGSIKRYPCGCTASHPDPDVELPDECPTHSVPPGGPANEMKEAA